jgi:hypothetical protein
MFQTSIKRMARGAVGIVALVATAFVPMALAATSASAAGNSPAGYTSYPATATGQAATYSCDKGATLSGSTCTITGVMNPTVCTSSAVGGTFNSASGTCTYSYYAVESGAWTCVKGGSLYPGTSYPTSATSWGATASCLVAVKTVAKHATITCVKHLAATKCPAGFKKK